MDNCLGGYTQSGMARIEDARSLCTITWILRMTAEAGKYRMSLRQSCPESM